MLADCPEAFGGDGTRALERLCGWVVAGGHSSRAVQAVAALQVGYVYTRAVL